MGESIGPFEVVVDDEFYPGNAASRYSVGRFEDVDEALSRCLRIVEEQLVDFLQHGVPLDEVYGMYSSWGERPSVVGPGVQFCPLAYAQALISQWKRKGIHPLAE